MITSASSPENARLDVKNASYQMMHLTRLPQDFHLCFQFLLHHPASGSQDYWTTHQAVQWRALSPIDISLQTKGSKWSYISNELENKIVETNKARDIINIVCLKLIIAFSVQNSYWKNMKILLDFICCNEVNLINKNQSMRRLCSNQLINSNTFTARRPVSERPGGMC